VKPVGEPDAGDRHVRFFRQCRVARARITCVPLPFIREPHRPKESRTWASILSAHSRAKMWPRRGAIVRQIALGGHRCGKWPSRLRAVKRERVSRTQYGSSTVMLLSHKIVLRRGTTWPRERSQFKCRPAHFKSARGSGEGCDECRRNCSPSCKALRTISSVGRAGRPSLPIPTILY